ncbi:MAG: hypothetical protein EP306_12580 [Burkholderiales bacterium]|nr:MAG: hypothetical protein EP306_12580 [Burkholderiales bacterium]
MDPHHPTLPPGWRLLPEPASAGAVPPAYRGVWVRTLLETPEGRDTTTRVHWLQTALWHADLRVPAGVDLASPAGRARLQGFFGHTRITPGHGGQPDVCTWHRLWDIQPPRSTPDAGTMVFETPERVIETGVHGQYLEVWERLPGSTAPLLALESVHPDGQPGGQRLFIAGRYAITVRPRTAPWPADLRPDETLDGLVQRHPGQAAALLDFDVEFGDAPAWATAGQPVTP